MSSIVIIGAGGHGREVLQVIRDAGRPFAGFVDDREPDRSLLERLDATWLGPTSVIPTLAGAPYLIGVGAGSVRRDLDRVATGAGMRAATVVHPMSSVGNDVHLEDGVVIFAFATITTNVRVGRHCHVGRGVAVGHDTRLDDFVSLYPLAAVSGNVVLESEATVGTNASVKQGVRVHRGAVIGLGAAVIDDIPANAVAVGVPARVRDTTTYRAVDENLGSVGEHLLEPGSQPHHSNAEEKVSLLEVRARSALRPHGEHAAG